MFRVPASFSLKMNSTIWSIWTGAVNNGQIQDFSLIYRKAIKLVLLLSLRNLSL